MIPITRHFGRLFSAVRNPILFLIAVTALAVFSSSATAITWCHDWTIYSVTQQDVNRQGAWGPAERPQGSQVELPARAERRSSCCQGRGSQRQAEPRRFGDHLLAGPGPERGHGPPAGRCHHHRRSPLRRRSRQGRPCRSLPPARQYPRHAAQPQGGHGPAELPRRRGLDDRHAVPRGTADGTPGGFQRTRPISASLPGPEHRSLAQSGGQHASHRRATSATGLQAVPSDARRLGGHRHLLQEGSALRDLRQGRVQERHHRPAMERQWPAQRGLHPDGQDWRASDRRRLG